jgi:hypothetical protein
VDIENSPSTWDLAPDLQATIDHLVPRVAAPLDIYFSHLQDNVANILELKAPTQWRIAAKQLQELETAYASIQEFSGFYRVPLTAEDYLIEPAGPSPWPVLDSNIYPGDCPTQFSTLKTYPYNYPTQVSPSLDDFEALLTYFAEPVTFKVQAASLLAWIVNGARTFDLLQKLFRRIQQLRRILRSKYSRFCGLTWSRRVWFLLHGSHPPKPETWLTQGRVFGCA